MYKILGCDRETWESDYHLEKYGRVVDWTDFRCPRARGNREPGKWGEKYRVFVGESSADLGLVSHEHEREREETKCM